MVAWIFKDGTMATTEGCQVCGLRDKEGQRPVKAIVPVDTSEEDLYEARCALHGSPKYDTYIVDTEGKKLM